MPSIRCPGWPHWPSSRSRTTSDGAFGQVPGRIFDRKSRGPPRPRRTCRLPVEGATVKPSKRWTLAISLCLGLAATAACAPGGGGAGGAGGSGGDNRLLIGTAGEGGTYFYVGQGFARAISDSTDIAATSQGTAGGTENVRRISSGDMDMGFAAPADVRKTIEDGTADASKLQVLMSGHATVTHIAVRADSDIKTLDQLMVKGRRLGVGEPGSNVQNITADMLGAYGLSLKDVRGQELSQSDQVTALQNGEIEGANLGGGLPLASASEIGTNVGVRILPISDEAMAKIQKSEPEQFREVIPKGMYEGTDEDVPSIAYPTLILVRADLPKDVAYKVTKTVFEQREKIAKVHPAGDEYTMDTAFREADSYTKEFGLKFHPGAIQWYQEKGAWDKKYE
ncbi:MAG: TAXI family TRAP transporter solute-binding subunit [Streptosporangiales bacterium]|nr:TAXI family TRAP transporter solute-binding subunit [Streptosporangiales bacterium]